VFAWTNNSALGVLFTLRTTTSDGGSVVVTGQQQLRRTIPAGHHRSSVMKLGWVLGTVLRGRGKWTVPSFHCCLISVSTPTRELLCQLSTA